MYIIKNRLHIVWNVMTSKTADRKLFEAFLLLQILRIAMAIEVVVGIYNFLDMRLNMHVYDYTIAYSLALGDWQWDVTLHTTGVIILCGVFSLACVAMLFATAGIIQKWRTELLTSATLSNPIAADHGDTIAEVIHNIWREPVEYTALFTADGEKVDESTLLNPARTQTRSYAMDYAKTHLGCVDIHNHPNSNAAFSVNDIRFAFVNHITKSVVIAKTMVYTIEFPENFWETIDLNQLCHSLRRVDGNRYATISSCNEDDLQAIYWIGKHEALAAEYGFTFRAEPYKKSAYYREFKYGKSEQAAQTSETAACMSEPDIDKTAD